MDYKEIYKKWLEDDRFDDETKKDLLSIKDDDEEIKDRFHQSLKFGTAGLRGKLGAGTNRMNVYNVAQATQGFADTIAEAGDEAKKKGVAIAYDVRHKSEEFAKVTAEVFAANGIKVYIHKEIQPTPVCSYTIRKLGNVAGVMVTASHNPREYNGYKAYNHEGSQILDETADKILGHIAEHPDFFEIPRMDFDKALEEGIVEYVDDQLIEDYIKEVKACTINDEAIDKNINVVYTPLNGCGNKLVRRILDERGFKNVHIVKEQENPDPDFTTVGYPNPEDPKAFKYSETLGKEVGADLLLATDPDSDRCAVEIRDKDGEYKFLTGNLIGSLLANYILEALAAKGQLPENGAVVKSLVSTDLVKPIANKYGVRVYDVLTGFKNIYAVANELDENESGKFIFGFEESIGYNYKDFVRDKDAVNSAMMITEMAAYYKERNKSLLDVIEDLFKEFGYYSNDVISIVLEGLDGQERISRIMSKVRNNPIKELCGLKVKTIVDYQKDETGLPKSNVLKYYLEDNSWFALRPSGTEPKIKLYINAIGESSGKSQEKLKGINDFMQEVINSIE
ncbi:phospho-sugar mutase [Anaerococcus tetradius]|uniref:Phosphoglucomutase n=1 Tax=Anaerococcus tetradius ATCC 35098 TaxID=525255 RepID=C2CFU4_9FIRM|nr:phospho-sugar mutase [Anaerococcus tetradius]EEI83625.1 phosphoglucomutase/phosphomannomutase, alpha/beta/alpha domain II [Anaerococcus tetradius ATCC 35098]